MRVLHYRYTFSPISETFLYDYVREQQAQGVDAHVLAVHRVNSTERPLANVHQPAFAPKWNPRRIFHKVRGVVQAHWTGTPYAVEAGLEKEIRQIEPDVIHAHFGPSGVALAPIAERLGIPLIVQFYGRDISARLRQPTWVERYHQMLPMADAVIGISTHICEKLIRLGVPEAKLHKLHLGVDTTRFEYEDPAERFSGESVICLHVGRLTEKKSPLHLVEAFRKVVDAVDERLSVKLVIAGDGELRERLEDKIAELSLRGHVQLVGRVSHLRVAELLREAHIYTQHCVTASDGDQEGQGVTFVEASASGLPIVATEHNGLPDVIIHGETGYLVPERDTAEMARRIVELIDDPGVWTQFGKAGHAHIEEKFSLPKQVRKGIAITKQIASTGKTGNGA